jgi:hypothetical protein
MSAHPGPTIPVLLAIPVAGRSEAPAAGAPRAGPAGETSTQVIAG